MRGPRWMLCSSMILSTVSRLHPASTAIAVIDIPFAAIVRMEPDSFSRRRCRLSFRACRATSTVLPGSGAGALGMSIPYALAMR
ncbi:hypothetical protein D9M69_559290 [compost metagenome]